MSSRVMKAAACGGDQRVLDGELEEKLLLHDGGLARRSAGAAALLQKRGIERHRLPRVPAGQGGAEDASDYRERFVRAYDRLRDELLADDSCELTDEARRWVEQMIDYNVPGGKLNRGLSVIDSYLLLKQGSEITEDEFFLACVLGWCVEWVGLRGINDGILLKCHIARLIKKYFREKNYYIDISELWNEIGLQTSLGQMLDLISTHNGADELAKYNIEGYHRIVKYKTSYYSFYLPVACALLLSGAKLENFSELRDILIEMGVYFQAQDDYLDCFADPNTIGKIGTDIEDHKCSWLIVQALGHANINQIEVLLKNYGKKDSASVSKVKSTYSTLDLKDMFSEFGDRAYKHLVTSIEAQHDRAVQEILKSFLKKIHRRKK
ncbi:hypothetical protein C2845_PM15G23960 [Panicum miliaceum]|uniref:Uncharacterized protein n=1 Tax=Panicum miliaceum TaxID=4540 RepID=A0A3L6Q7H8_PANMI|nr:hypothetical protein C2845_PM15G23960 [Panicum miliaceum]